MAILPGPQARQDGRFSRLASSLTIRLAGPADLPCIYRLRHAVYAAELGQHPVNAEGQLHDALDAFNRYVVAVEDGAIIGFVSVTPPGAPQFSVDKYFARATLPFAFDDKLFEIRILTVMPPHRGRDLNIALMYGALRLGESLGGRRVVAIGRREILSLYRGVGLKPQGRTAQSGAVTYELMTETVTGIHNYLARVDRVLSRLQQNVDWQLPFPFWPTNGCYHGGAFFQAIGVEFDQLETRDAVINADVLDAWFPPSPKVLETLHEHLDWLVSTSPPTGSEGLIEVIARARDIPPDCILPGAGSSDLIFLALRHWLKPTSRALILEPTYSEYPHVLEKVVGCQVDRLLLRREQNYRVDLAALEERLATGYGLVVLVNPNSPTGQAIEQDKLAAVLTRAPVTTRFWIDETYIEYFGTDQSLERFAATRPNVVISKSMSKVYALSGLRAAYLCAAPAIVDELRKLTPPWAVGLAAQVAAVRALQDLEYYAQRYRETHELRGQLADELRTIPGLTIMPSVAGWLLCHLPPAGPNANTFIQRCRARGLFLRNVSGDTLGTHAIRISVKDAATNQRMVTILRQLLLPSA